MTDTSRPPLVRLSDSELLLAFPAEDVRGRAVLDRSGEEIGTVDDLLIDEHEAKVRFLHITTGGVLGIGDRTFLLPVAAVTRIDDTHVYIDQTRDRVAESPPFDPDMVLSDPYFADLYDYYDYPPFWLPGYVPPPYPYTL